MKPNGWSITREFFRKAPSNLLLAFLAWGLVGVVSAREIDPELCLACHDRPNLSKRAQSVHANLACTACHIEGPFEAHMAKPAPVNCSPCHEKESGEYQQSSHGLARLGGNLEAPNCLTCHGDPHEIRSKTDPTSWHGRGNVTRLCARCHDDLLLAERYGFSAGRVNSYRSSYHGLAIRGGSVTVADCASCHGAHAILSSSDSRSQIHPTNLTETCGGCHLGATDAFAKTPVHLSVSPTSLPILHWVRLAYLWLIGVVIGGMLLHNLLIYVTAVVAKFRKEKRGVERFSKLQLLLHGMLAISFITLVVTGFALRFTELGIAESYRGIVHRGAALLLMGIGLMHVIVTVFTHRGRKELSELWPRWRDVRELYGTILAYLLRLQKRDATLPPHGKYSYVQKIEYWAMLWGTVIMMVTGFALWFPVVASGYLPPWGIPLMDLIHYYEAWLATLAFVVWHLFFVVFDPKEYPMNLTWIDGKTSEEESTTASD